MSDKLEQLVFLFFSLVFTVIFGSSVYVVVIGRELFNPLFYYFALTSALLFAFACLIIVIIEFIETIKVFFHKENRKERK